MPPQVALRERAGEGASASRAPRGEIVLGVDTIVALDGRIYGKPRRRGGRRGRRSRRSPARPTRSSAGSRSWGRGEPRTRDRGDGGDASGRSTTRIDWYLRPASGASARAVTRSRARARRSSPRSTATIPTSSGCRSRHCSTSTRAAADAFSNNRSQRPDPPQLQRNYRGTTPARRRRRPLDSARGGQHLPSRRQSASGGSGVARPVRYTPATLHRWVSSAT